MKSRFFEVVKGNAARWEEVLKKHPEANFLQSPEYAWINLDLGCEALIEDFGGDGWAVMIVRNARRGRYLEIPCGPLIDWGDEELVMRAIEKIREIARREKCVFVRMRPQIYATSENLALLKRFNLKVAPMHLAAENTVMIDLTQSEESMLAGMRRQTRYEVRRAEKLGIKVERLTGKAALVEFHAVQAETAKRQNFVPPSLETLKALGGALQDKYWIYRAVLPGDAADNAANTTAGGAGDSLNEGKDGANNDRAGQPIAYGLIIACGKEADYYEAASTDLNRKLPGAYALLWQAMRDMKAAGYERFNLWGIAPAGQPHHRYAGVTTFKTGFGGSVINFVPAHDLVISSLKYLKNCAVELARKKRRHL